MKQTIQNENIKMTLQEIFCTLNRIYITPLILPTQFPYPGKPRQTPQHFISIISLGENSQEMMTHSTS